MTTFKLTNENRPYEILNMLESRYCELKIENQKEADIMRGLFFNTLPDDYFFLNNSRLITEQAWKNVHISNNWKEYDYSIAQGTAFFSPLNEDNIHFFNDFQCLHKSYKKNKEAVNELQESIQKFNYSIIVNINELNEYLLDCTFSFNEAFLLSLGFHPSKFSNFNQLLDSSGHTSKELYQNRIREWRQLDKLFKRAQGDVNADIYSYGEISRDDFVLASNIFCEVKSENIKTNIYTDIPWLKQLAEELLTNNYITSDGNSPPWKWSMQCNQLVVLADELSKRLPQYVNRHQRYKIIEQYFTHSCKKGSLRKLAPCAKQQVINNLKKIVNNLNS